MMSDQPVNPFDINKANIARSFNRAAQSFDQHAQLQHLIGERLVERLDYVKIKPELILDLGCSTGKFTRQLQQHFKKSKVLGVDLAWQMLSVAQSNGNWLKKWTNKERYTCADAEKLPFADNSFDLIYSNLMLYWLDNPDTAFRELNRIIKPGGLLIFTSFGPDTLKEMRQSWAIAQGKDALGKNSNHVRVNRFLDMHDIGDSLTKSGFGGTVMDSETITMNYCSVAQVHADLKAMGETNMNAGRTRNMTGKDLWQTYEQAYNQHKTAENELPTSWEVIYGHAWAGERQIPKGPSHPGTIGIKTL